MQLDIRSLLVAVALASLFCAGARLLLWRMHPTIPGLGRWALAGAASTFMFFFIIFYGISYWEPALSLAQLLAVIGLVLAWDGFRRFIGRPPLSSLVLAVLAIIMLIWITTVQLQNTLLIRALGNSILVATLSALIAHELLNTAKPIPLAMRSTGWIYAINSAVFLIRSLVTDFNISPAGPMNPDGVAAFVLLWWLCTTIAITLGMVLMTSERLQTVLDRQANRDPLTGALNRRSFSIIAEKEISRSHRHDIPFSILMMDLDKFKQINDRLGHDSGDELLCQFVAVASKALRDEDIFCRFGGEEFVALLPNTPAEEALVAAERLRTAFAQETAEETSDKGHLITVSIGIAEFEQDEDIKALLRRADISLYEAKGAGRNCCVLSGKNN